MENCNKVCTLIVPGNKLVKDKKGKSVNVTEFRQMIGCIMYMLATRPDLTFSISCCKKDLVVHLRNYEPKNLV
jgi:hypothetical protein